MLAGHPFAWRCLFANHIMIEESNRWQRTVIVAAHSLIEGRQLRGAEMLIILVSDRFDLQ